MATIKYWNETTQSWEFAGSGFDGNDGGYYKPVFSQVDESTINISFQPSDSEMPEIPSVLVNLPAGPKGDAGYTPQKGVDYFDGKDGENGEPGADGITPHIGENGNWFIGETDTGISATGENYTLPAASANALGGVRADSVTDSDTQPVHIDEAGNLFTAPGSNFVVQPEAPEDTNVLWIDTDDEIEVVDHYYTPTVSQPNTNTMRVEYAPSAETMPAVPAVDVTLPVGPKGDNGISGNDGITPHVGENGNWFIGETDTGISASSSQDKTLGIAGATVGQIAKITEVDENGVPTEWEAAEMLAGGGIGRAKTKKLMDVTITEPTAALSVTLEHNYHKLLLTWLCETGTRLVDADGAAASGMIGVIIDSASFGWNSRKVGMIKDTAKTWSCSTVLMEWSEDRSMFLSTTTSTIIVGTPGSKENHFGGSSAMMGVTANENNAPTIGRTVNIIPNGMFLAPDSRIVLVGEYYE